MPVVLAAGLASAVGLAGCVRPGTATSRASPPAGTSTSQDATARQVLPALDGVYVADVAPAELLSHGSPDAVDENFGHFVFVFDHGINVQGQESAHACTWSVHSVTDVGHGVIGLPTLAAGGIAPNGANAKVGEPVELMRWTLYRGVLTLDPYSPETFWIKPFRRVSSTPSLAWFSHRCPPPADALKPG